MPGLTEDEVPEVASVSQTNVFIAQERLMAEFRRSGDPHADLIFGDLIDRRADRLLDELLRHREAASDRQPSRCV